MRYREYRRKCKETKDKRARVIHDSCGYPSPYSARNKTGPDSTKWDRWADDAASADYIIKHGRGDSSRILKKLYNRKLRHSSKLNMETFGGSKSGYKYASGDFWWDYC